MIWGNAGSGMGWAEVPGSVTYYLCDWESQEFSKPQCALCEMG